MDEPHVETQLLAFFAALGQKERLAIVGQLILEPLTVPELSRRLNVKEMDLLHHLALLQETGFVRGNEEQYWFDLDRLHALNRAVWPAVRPAPPAAADSDEEIARRYMRGGRLSSLPVKESRLEIVLKWVIEQVPEGRTFSEREISDLLQNVYDDYASLRRYLVDFGLLARDHGVYWRVRQED